MDWKKNYDFDSFERRYAEKEKEQRAADRNAFKKAEKRKKKIEEQKKKAASTNPSFGSSSRLPPPPPPILSVDTKRKDMLSRLGLSPSETDGMRIKTAYKSLALKLHPDKNGGQDAEFKKVLEAYEYLCAK
jgi:hypothetical protein